MVSVLDSGFEPWPGALCCVLGQDTLLGRKLDTYLVKVVKEEHSCHNRSGLYLN